jgi:hypothetical protein
MGFPCLNLWHDAENQPIRQRTATHTNTSKKKQQASSRLHWWFFPTPFILATCQPIITGSGKVQTSVVEQ